MELIQRIPFEDQPRKIRFSQNGARIAMMSRFELVIYSIPDYSEIKRLEMELPYDVGFIGPTQIVLSMRDGNRESKLVIYDLEKEQIIAETPTEGFRSVCVDPQQDRVFSGDAFGTDIGGVIYVYDRHLNQQYELQSGADAWELDICDSGQTLVVGGIYFELWDTTSFPKRILYNYPPPESCVGIPCEVNGVDVTPDGHYVMGSIYNSIGACFLMDVKSRELAGWYGPRPHELGYTIEPRAAALSPDGKYIAVSYHKVVGIYTIPSNSVVKEIQISNCETLAFSPNGNILAIGGNDSVTLWRFDLNSQTN